MSDQMTIFLRLGESSLKRSRIFMVQSHSQDQA